MTAIATFISDKHDMSYIAADDHSEWMDPTRRAKRHSHRIADKVGSGAGFMYGVLGCSILKDAADMVAGIGKINFRSGEHLPPTHCEMFLEQVNTALETIISMRKKPLPGDEDSTLILIDHTRSKRRLVKAEFGKIFQPGTREPQVRDCDAERRHVFYFEREHVGDDITPDEANSSDTWAQQCFDGLSEQHCVGDLGARVIERGRLISKRSAFEDFRAFVRAFYM